MAETLTRVFTAELAEGGDGRTVVGRCVPFGVAASVSDPPDYRPYREMFRAGAFQAATRAPNRVLLDFEHESGIRGVVGHGASLEERPDGLHGEFRVHNNLDGNKALTLIREGVVTGFSVCFAPQRNRTGAGGVVERTKVALDRVSLCRVPAYDDAKVLAVRTRPQLRRQPRPVFDPVLLAGRLDRLGVPVPTALKRIDVEDLETVAAMIKLGAGYIQDQDETDDQANIPRMEAILGLLAELVPVEAAENEPVEPEDDD